MEPGDGGGRHSDEELASAMEDEVARMTASIPIIAGPNVMGPADRDSPSQGRPPHGPGEWSDAEVTALVDADLATHDTLGAIEHLQTVLEARATAALPVVGEADADAPETDAGESSAAEAVDDAEDEIEIEIEDEIRPPTQLISFDDLPVRRDPTGPQPTFSAWVAAAVVPKRSAPPVKKTAPVEEPIESESQPVPDSQPSDESVETRPEPAPDPEPTPPLLARAALIPALPPAPAAAGAPERAPTRAEPLGLVPADLAPSDSQPVPLLAELPVVQGVPVVTASTITHDIGALGVPAEHLDTDVVDDADDHAGAPAPVATPRLAEGEVVLIGAEPIDPHPLVPEATDLAPTPLDQRAGRAARMFWLWFAGTSSLISVGVGATLFSLGLSLRQLLVATLVGVALSFLPLGLGTLAGKWSGQPTMVVSRAAFGLLGNAVPAALALVTKLFWGAVLLWLAGSAAGSLARAEGWPVDATVATAIALAITILAAGVVAYFGYGLVARVQSILTIASAALIGLTVMVTWRHVDLSRALSVPDALWTHVVTGAVLVFSYLGLAWAMSSAEVARYQRSTSSGAAAMLWATFGAAVPPFILVSYGGLLAASNPGIADLLARDPVGALARLGLPWWFAAPLLLAVGLSLVSGLVLTIYSGGFTLETLGARLGRRWSTLVVAAAIALAGFTLAITVSDLGAVIRGVPTALSVPVAAWVGLFTGDMMLRSRRFHSPSLVSRGGVYPDWRWVNLAMLVVATVIGLGLVNSPLPWLAWEGYLFRLFGADPLNGLGASTIGVLVALGIGLLTPLVSGLPAVRRQERAQEAEAAAG